MWTLETLPSQWALPAGVPGGAPALALDKRSTCELEADACVEHVLNRAEVGLVRPRGVPCAPHCMPRPGAGKRL